MGSKIWKYVIFIALTAIVFFSLGMLGEGNFVEMLLGGGLTGLFRDGLKDDNSALKQFVERKKNEIKNTSDDDLAGRVDSQ